MGKGPDREQEARGRCATLASAFVFSQQAAAQHYLLQIPIVRRLHREPRAVQRVSLVLTPALRLADTEQPSKLLYGVSIVVFVILCH